MSPDITQKLQRIYEQKQAYQAALHGVAEVDSYHDWLKDHLSRLGRASVEFMQKNCFMEEMISFVLKTEEQNYSDAFDFIQEKIAQQAPFSTDFAKAVHAQIVKNLPLMCPGAYRKGLVLMPGTAILPPSGEEVPEKMEALVEKYLEAMKENRPLEQAFDLHYNLFVLQPFSDANKRVARLLMNSSLMRHGFAPTIILPVHRQAYVKAINDAYTTHKKDNYYAFMAERLEESTVKATCFLKTLPKKVSRNEGCTDRLAEYYYERDAVNY